MNNIKTANESILRAGRNELNGIVKNTFFFAMKLEQLKMK